MKSTDMISSKPDWIRKRLPTGNHIQGIEQDLLSRNLRTICQEARCPNQGECFSRGTATFLIMGSICTRNCRFCAVNSGKPESLDEDEPERVADAVRKMKLRYVVITSVTRDDLPDGGAGHFARSIRMVRKKNPDAKIEVLISDLGGSIDSLKTVIEAEPDVLNHNIETVPRLYSGIRPKADYGRSIKLLNDAKTVTNSILVTKSGMMVGMGETTDEVMGVMKNLKDAQCDILTIGQYLCPSGNHYPVWEYVKPEMFAFYRKTALKMGFTDVVSSPFARSSFMVEKSFRIALGEVNGWNEQSQAEISG